MHRLPLGTELPVGPRLGRMQFVHEALAAAHGHGNRRARGHEHESLAIYRRVAEKKKGTRGQTTAPVEQACCRLWRGRVTRDGVSRSQHAATICNIKTLLMHISLISSKSRFSWNYAFLMVPKFSRIVHITMRKCIFVGFSAGCRK